MNVIEFDEQCKSCNGTGLYIGMAEKDGAAIVCHNCKGTGCNHVKIEYESFTNRKRNKVKWVYETNPGFGVGNGNGYKFSDFGGMSIEEWEGGMKFGAETENRLCSCPSWWYQSSDYKKKPIWDECIGIGAFRDCKCFKTKDRCWEKFDRENS